MHLFRKHVAQQLKVLGAEHGVINKHMNWADDVQSKYYSLADLQAGDRPQAILAGFTKGWENWHQHHYLVKSTVSLPSASWLDAIIPRLTETLQWKDALPVRSQEMLQCFAHVCRGLLASLAKHLQYVNSRHVDVFEMQRP